MIVTRENLSSVLAELARTAWLGLDLETTGLNAYQGDTIFGISLAVSDDRGFYFPVEFLPELKPIFDAPDKCWSAHNAKFDLGFFLAAGYTIAGPVYCTLTLARVQYNDHLSYSLDACAKRLGFEKDDAVKKYLEEHKLYEKVKIPGKKTIFKNYHFDQVPVEIMAPYAVKDAGLAKILLRHQFDTFAQWELTRAHKKVIGPVVELERKFTGVVVEMEKNGIRVDRAYCEQAAAHEASRIDLAKREFRALTGSDFVDSAKSLTEVFGRFGIDPGRTKKGNPSFTDAVLAKLSHPVAHTVQTYRDAAKRSGTYFSSFLYYSARNGRIHCSFNQGGTGTGRLSASSPNLQNLPANAEGEDCAFPARRAFVADPNHVLVSLDWKALEYYLLIDQAGQMDLIAEVKAGKDLHMATAELMGLSGPTARNTAKTINFMLLYQGGISKLAATLFECIHDEDTLKAICRRWLWGSRLKDGDAALLKDLIPAQVEADLVQLRKADELKKRYFAALPQVEAWVNGVIETAKRRGYVFNWLGRRSHFPEAAGAYKAPNYVVQGGGGDLMKTALVSMAGILAGRRSKLLLTIHDEVVLSMHEKELDLIPVIKEAMLDAYPHRHLRLEAAVYTGDNLYDMEPYCAPADTRISAL